MQGYLQKLIAPTLLSGLFLLQGCATEPDRSVWNEAGESLQIDSLQFCQRADGYGVYEPLVDSRFPAGRENRALVYYELYNFAHELTDDGRFEVRIAQQVELYNATGGTAIWRQGPVEMADVSRNKRRDFFVVCPIDLPAGLSAGEYRLKVCVADKHSGSVSEQTLHNIRIVAAQALVERGQ